MEWKDNELTDEEIEIVKNGINSGKIDETINLMGKEELSQLKERIVDKKLTFSIGKYLHIKKSLYIIFIIIFF